MPMTDDELYKDILHRWNTLADAVEKLYFAGYWHCDRPVDERALWQAVRDAARIPPGMTGYTLGEDRSHGPSRHLAPHVDGRDFYELCQQYRHAKEIMPHPSLPNTAQAFRNLQEYIKTGKLPWPSYEEANG